MFNDSNTLAPTPSEPPSPNSRPQRKYQRNPLNATTFIKRLAPTPGDPMRVNIIDISENGLGFSAFAPLRAGEILAVGLTLPNCPPQILLVRVQHCSKNTTGQYRFGVAILGRQPGDIVKIRIPEEWLAAAN